MPYNIQNSNWAKLVYPYIKQGSLSQQKHTTRVEKRETINPKAIAIKGFIKEKALELLNHYSQLKQHNLVNSLLKKINYREKTHTQFSNQAATTSQ